MGSLPLSHVETLDSLLRFHTDRNRVTISGREVGVAETPAPLTYVLTPATGA